MFRCIGVERLVGGLPCLANPLTSASLCTERETSWKSAAGISTPRLLLGSIFWVIYLGCARERDRIIIVGPLAEQINLGGLNANRI